MIVQFIDLGRNKFNATMELKSGAAVRKIVAQKILSKCIDYVFDEEKQEYAVVVGGFQVVGRIKMLSDKQ